jgi:hypothetical protein
MGCGTADAAEVLMHIGKVFGREELIPKGRSMIDPIVRRLIPQVSYVSWNLSDIRKTGYRNPNTEWRRNLLCRLLQVRIVTRTLLEE